MTALLELEFGGHLLRPDPHPPELSLVVDAGELVWPPARNASGKSTTLKTILGLVDPRAGAVRFGGEDVTKRSTSYRDSAGMAIVPENRRLFAPMSVSRTCRWAPTCTAAGRRKTFDRVYELFPLLYERRAQLAGRCRAASSRWSRWAAR